MILRNRRVAVGAALLTLVPLAAVLVLIGIRSESADAAAGAPVISELAPGSAAMIARIDSETGVVGVASEAAPLELDPGTLRALSRSAEGLVPVTHPDGSVSVHLQGRFQSASVARLDETGRVIVCTDHEEHATVALRRSVDPNAEVQ